MEKLIETVVAEVILQLKEMGVDINFENKAKPGLCSCQVEKINPSNCRTSELSKKYFLSIKTEINEMMAL